MEFTATPTYDDENSNQSQATKWLGLGWGRSLGIVDAYYYLPLIQYLYWSLVLGLAIG